MKRHILFRKLWQCESCVSNSAFAHYRFMVMMIINLLPTVCFSRTKLPLQCGSQSQFGLRNPRIWQLSDVTNCSSFGCFRVHIPSWCLCLLGRELVIHHGTTGSYRLSEHCLCPAPEQIRNPFTERWCLSGFWHSLQLFCSCFQVFKLKLNGAYYFSMWLIRFDWKIQHISYGIIDILLCSAQAHTHVPSLTAGKWMHECRCCHWITLVATTLCYTVQKMCLHVTSAIIILLLRGHTFSLVSPVSTLKHVYSLLWIYITFSLTHIKHSQARCQVFG